MCSYPVVRPGPDVIKLFSCSTELSMNFVLVKNFKMPTIVVILKFITKTIGIALAACILISMKMGAQWLSGRVLDSRPRGRGFEPHGRHCVVVLEQDTFILA